MEAISANRGAFIPSDLLLHDFIDNNALHDKLKHFGRLLIVAGSPCVPFNCGLDPRLRRLRAIRYPLYSIKSVDTCADLSAIYD